MRTHLCIAGNISIKHPAGFRFLKILILFSLLLGCGHKLSGPKPEVEGIDPALVCTEQLTTVITISGSSLSPLTADSATKDPELRLPTVTLQPSTTLDGEPIPGDPENFVVPADLLTWTSRESMTMEINPELALEPGVYDLVVENANGNSVTFSDGLVAVPPPELHAVEPDLFCTAQGANTLTLTGTGFLRVGDAMPQVYFGDEAFTAASVSDCTTLAGPIENAEYCDTLTVEIPTDGVDTGSHQVRVVNPMPAGCASSEEVTVAVVPPPSVQSVEPDLICNEQHENILTISGSGFLDVEGDLPTVTIGGIQFEVDSVSGCSAVEGTLLSASSCSTITLTVPADVLPLGALDVVVTNPEPASCVSEDPVTLASAPPPVLDAVEPDLLCLDEADMTLTLTGSGFLHVEGELPVVTVGDTDIPAESISNCSPVLGTLLDAQTCTTLTVTIPQGSLPTGSYPVVVTNPPPADCMSTEEVFIAVVDSPEVFTLEPDMICNEQGDDSLTIEGTNFLSVDGELPAVNIGGETFAASSVSNCEEVEGTATSTQRCTILTVEIPEGSLPEGAHEVTVTNPPPAACTSPAGPSLYVLPPPVITSSLTDPPCTQNPEALTLEGSGFLVIDGVQPIVMVNGTDVTITAISGCSEITGPSLSTQTCTTISVALPAGLLTMGEYQVEVLNPSPAGCSYLLESAIGLPPVISSINPIRICETGGEITVNGSNFLDGAQVFIGTTIADYTIFVSENVLTVGVPAGLGGGLHDVTVMNPDGCTDTLEEALQIIELPLVYFVDPSVVFNGINTQVTIFASGIAGEVIDVSIRPSGEVDPLIPLDFNFDPAKPNRIQAIVPESTDAAMYDVIVTDDVGCIAVLVEGLTVTDELTLALKSIIPPFGWTEEETPVVMYAEETVVPPEVQFVATPRAYLNPSTPGDDTVATAIESVSFIDPERLNGVVPEGLPVGLYDLIVVNPTGEVGLLQGAFEVTVEPPPIVDSISPSSLMFFADQDAAIEGSNFRNPTLTGICRDPSDTEHAITGVANSFTDSYIDATFDMSGIPEGSVCIIRVQNDDGTYFDFSAVSVTNAAKNLTNFDAQNSMITGRRAPASVAGRPTRTARFLYAIGGDDGAPAGAYASVESAPVDMFGDLGVWFEQPYSLPAPRTHAKAVNVGRFIYLVGGNDGATVTDSVLRAEILSPRRSPVITDADIQLGEGDGLDGGIWYYRVSAVFPDTDDKNPGGESLASDPFVIKVPDMPEKIHIRIVWTEVAGASGYRIYRTPSPDMYSGSERLIAEVSTAPLLYTDEGDTTTDQAPLPFGATGTWMEMASLTIPREGPGLTAAQDPADDSTFHIYALGGRDENGLALASYEYLTVTILDDGDHDVFDFWSLGNTDMPAARWQMEGFLADHAHASIVTPGDTWIYAGGGVASNGTTLVRNVAAGFVEPGGDLGAWTSVTEMNPGRAGYGYTLANSQLYIFGGHNAAPSTGGASAEILGPPQLAAAWDSLAITMTEPRYLPASSTESAFIFIIGGWNGTTATSTVDKTVW